LERDAEPGTDNLLLRKLYRKGFRDGWDSVKTDSDTPASQKPSEAEHR